MQDVNEAWRVLRDPASRLAYDRSLARAARPSGARPRPSASSSSPPPPPAAGDDLVDVAPPVGAGVAQFLRGLPWAVLLLVLGAIFVFTAYAAGGRGDGVVGSCASPTGSPGTTVACGTPGAGRVGSVVEPQRACPPGATRVRWDEDGTGVCVTPP
jgi:hypothetical protein